MKSIFIYIISGLFGLCLSHCTYKKLSHLSPDEVEWLGDYKEWERILFSSSAGKTDTIMVSDMTLSNSRGLYSSFNTGVRNTNAWGNIGIYIGYHTNECTDIYYSIEKSYGGSFQQEIDLSYEENNKWSFPKTDQQHRTGRFEVDGKEFAECLIVDFSYPDSTAIIRDWYIDKLVWAKGTGLIYYRRRNGNEFRISRVRIPPKRLKLNHDHNL